MDAKPILPALDRALHILDQLIRSEGSVRYQTLKGQLTGIQDSTLSRTLKALETYGYIDRDPDLGYSITAKVHAWSPYLGNEKEDFLARAQKEVDRLVEQGGESAAVVQLTEDRIATLCSKTVHEGIQVLDPGDTLHFEADHAAAIAVLAQLHEDQRTTCLAGPFSRFPQEAHFEEIYHAMQPLGTCLIDRSHARPGICRIAQGFQIGEHPCAIFYCLTIDALQAKQETLATLLKSAADGLQR